jgi:hypothetical protein
MLLELSVSKLLALKPQQSKRGSIGGKKAYKSAMPPTKEILFEEKMRIQHLFRRGTTAKDTAKKQGKHIAIIKTLPPDELPPPLTKRPGRKKAVH